MKKTLTIVTATLVSVFASAQYTTDKVVGDKKTELIDSLKKADYPYLFPIWGKKVVNKGFDIPKSAALAVWYLAMLTGFFCSKGVRPAHQSSTCCCELSTLAFPVSI